MSRPRRRQRSESGSASAAGPTAEDGQGSARVGGNAHWLRAAVLLVAGWLLVWIAGAYAGAAQYGDWPAASAPFVLNRVLIVHLLAVLPLSLWLGWRLARPLPGHLGWLIPLVAGIGLTGGFAAGLGGWATTQLGGSDSSAGYHGLRLVLTVVLLLPWACASSAVIRVGGQALRGLWVDGLIVGLLCLLPIIHVQEVARRESQLITDHVVNQQYVDALGRCQTLVDLGCSMIGDQPAGAVLAGLEQRVATYRQELAKPLPADVDRRWKIDRARLLFGLGRYGEARQQLQPFADLDPEAALRLALIDEVQRNFQEAVDGYGKVIEMLRGRESLSGAEQSLLRAAFERRSNNLRRINDSRGAERELLAAVEQFPEIRPALLMQLGFHYQMAGRSSEALDYFERAAELDSRYQAQVEFQRQRLDLEAQGCLIRSNRGVTR